MRFLHIKLQVKMSLPLLYIIDQQASDILRSSRCIQNPKVADVLHFSHVLRPFHSFFAHQTYTHPQLPGMVPMRTGRWARELAGSAAFFSSTNFSRSN